MANPRAQRLSPRGLGRAPAPAATPTRRWPALALGVLGALALLAIAWFDGGERALRPIAQPVALPVARSGQGQ
jgi:ferric-dicitrate binding protein FerR (iron transport regulator)